MIDQYWVYKKLSMDFSSNVESYPKEAGFRPYSDKCCQQITHW